MIILLKKAVRDLLRSKMRTLSIILAIALSISLGIGLVNATRDALESFDKRLDDTNYEDIDIQFDMSEIDLDEIGAIDGVDQVSGRIFLETQAQYGEERYKAHWIASPYMEGKPYALINGYQITDGNPFSSPLSGECLVGSLFAGGNDLKIGEEVTIYADNITIPLTVSGIAASPEYIYVVSDTGWPEPALLMPLFTTYETAITELNLTGSTFNEVLITVKPGYEPDEVKAEVVTYLTGNGIRVTRSLLGTEELDYQFSRTDASAMGHMGWVFGVIILAVTAVVIYNSLARLIASQRPYIGVMGALGGRKIDIILHYCLFGALMGAVGAVIGVPLGMGMSYLIVIAYASVIGLIDPVTTIFWIYPLIFGSIGILISTLGAFLGSLKAVSIGPRAALTSQYSSQDFSNKPILERLFDIVAYRRPILPRIPLRNLSRHKVRTTITMISLAFSFLLVFTCLTMALSFTQPVEDNYEKYETWDLKALMIERVDILDAETLLTGPEFMDTGAEVTLDDFAPIILGDEMEFVHVQAFSSDSTLRNYNVIEGKRDFTRGVLVGSVLASNLNLKVDSSVTFLLGNVTTTTVVTGITGELMDDSILMSLDQSEELLLTGGMVNAIILDMGGESKDDLESSLRGAFPIATFAYSDDVVRGMESMLGQLIAMFSVFIIFGIISEVLFVSTTVVLNILDREMEFISLRAIGTKPGKIRRMIVTETLILLAGGLALGLPLGVITTRWAMSYMVEGMMYYVLEVPIAVYVITGSIATLSAVIASYVSANHITKVKLSDAIRQRAVT